MPDYSIKNLMQVDNSAASRGPGMEARFARKHLDSTELGVSLFRYAPNFRSPLAHRHREQEEAYVVTSGSGRVKLDDDIVELQKWDVLRVAPQVVRAFEGGPEGLELVAIGGHKPADGDGELVHDFWSED